MSTLNTRPNTHRVLIAALLAVSVFASMAPAHAMAHARLTSSSPAPGSALARMPPSIRMDFSEAVDPGYSSASLLAANGESFPVATAALAPESDSSLLFTIPAAASAPNGVYTLVWRVLSATDGHVTSGALAFSVGAGAAAASSAGANAPARPPWQRVAIRWLELLTIVVATGGFFFTTIVNPLEAGSRRLLTIACAALIGALLLGMYDQTNLIAGRGPFHPPALGVYRHALLDASGGREWLVRAGLALVMLVCGRCSARPLAAGAGLAAGGGALLTRSASGHAAGIGHATLAIAVDWIHLVSVSVWASGLVFLAVTLGSLDEPSVTAHVLSRFSKIALLSVTVLIATGLISASFHVAGATSLRSSDYGVVLIAKHLLFIPALIAAGVNLLVIVPRLRQATAPARVSALAASARRGVWVELSSVALVLVAAGALTELAPADGPLTINVASRIVTVDQSARAGDLRVQLLGRLTGEPGDRFVVTVSDASGAAPSGLQRLIVVSRDTADPAIGDRFDAEPLPGSPGSFFFPAVRIGLATTWNLSLIVRRAGLDDATADVQVDVRTAAVQPPRIASDHWSWPRLTLASYALAPLSLFLLIAGIAAVRRLPGLEPIAGALILTMTGLIAAGFLVQAVRSTVPITAGAALASPVAGDPGAVTRAAVDYTAYCLSCHGAAGEGVDVKETAHSHGGSAGLLSARAEGATNGDLFWYISSGVAETTMPAYDHALSEAERWDLVQYIRALQRAAGRSAAPSAP